MVTDVIEAVLLVGGEELVEFSEVDDFVEFGFVQFVPDGAGHFGVGDLGPVETFERHTGRRYVFFDDGFVQPQASGWRRWRRTVQRWRRWRRRKFTVVETVGFAVDEARKARRRAELEVFHIRFGVVRNTRT